MIFIGRQSFLKPAYLNIKALRKASWYFQSYPLAMSPERSDKLIHNMCGKWFVLQVNLTY